MKKIQISIVVSAALLAGCAQDDLLRTEGLTLGAGDAQATNTALQIIDPWQAGVEDTDLVVPSDRGETTEEAGTDSGTTPTPAPVNP